MASETPVHQLEDLQGDLDGFLAEYNTQRPHQGRWCYGKTPMQTFCDGVALAKEKQIVWRAARGNRDCQIEL